MDDAVTRVERALAAAGPDLVARCDRAIAEHEARYEESRWERVGSVRMFDADGAYLTPGLDDRTGWELLVAVCRG